MRHPAEKCIVQPVLMRRYYGRHKQSTAVAMQVWHSPIPSHPMELMSQTPNRNPMEMSREGLVKTSKTRIFSIHTPHFIRMPPCIAHIQQQKLMVLNHHHKLYSVQILIIFTIFLAALCSAWNIPPFQNCANISFTLKKDRFKDKADLKKSDSPELRSSAFLYT